MKEKDQVEAELNEAKSIHFGISRNYEKEPTVLILIFDKKHGGSHSYNWLLNNRGVIDKKLLIKKDKETLTLIIKHSISASR